jgi:hypothetical protein
MADVALRYVVPGEGLQRVREERGVDRPGEDDPEALASLRSRAFRRPPAPLGDDAVPDRGGGEGCAVADLRSFTPLTTSRRTRRSS